MRLTTTRTVTQAFFLTLFLWLLFKSDFSRIEDYAVSLFLQLDPLSAISTGEIEARWVEGPDSQPTLITLLRQTLGAREGAAPSVLTRRYVRAP